MKKRFVVKPATRKPQTLSVPLRSVSDQLSRLSLVSQRLDRLMSDHEDTLAPILSKVLAKHVTDTDSAKASEMCPLAQTIHGNVVLLSTLCDALEDITSRVEL